MPKEAEVQQVTVDGQDRPSRPEDGELRLTVPAGRHTVEVRWQQARGMGVLYGMPRVSFSSPAVDVTQQLTIPPERWLLATRGPAWGPAVLFWPYLVFLLVVAVALGRLPASPLTSAQWVLLGLGLSVLPAPAALVVAAFVFALALRGRRPLPGAWAFDGLQVLLAAWALVSLGLLYVAIHQGLLFRPDMQVAGGGQHRHGPPLVRRPRQRRYPGGGRPQPAPLALPRGDAAVGPVARGRPRARGGPRLARLLRGRRLAADPQADPTSQAARAPRASEGGRDGLRTTRLGSQPRGTVCVWRADRRSPTPSGSPAPSSASGRPGPPATTP